MVNFGPVIPVITEVVGVHSVVDQQFSYVRLAAPLLDTAAISTEFCWRSVLFYFTYSLQVVTDKPRTVYTIGSATHFCIACLKLSENGVDTVPLMRCGPLQDHRSGPLRCACHWSFYYHAMHYSAKGGLEIAYHLSVCPSVTSMDHDHIG